MLIILKLQILLTYQLVFSEMNSSNLFAANRMPLLQAAGKAANVN